MTRPPVTPVAMDPAEIRRRRRELMRAHHPDLGGDPELFVEALRRLDEDTSGGPPSEIRFARRRRTWVVQGRISFRRRRSRRIR